MESSGTSRSVWMATNTVPPFPPLKEDCEADVCVVGAGIAGITTAYLLAKEGVAVVLLDKGPILSGETERTTAHLSNELDDRYTEALRIHGEEYTKLAAQSHTAAIDFIEETVRSEKIDCDFRRVDGYLFLGEGQEESLLDEELEAARTAGLRGVEKLAAFPDTAARTGPCLRFPEQAQFHPTRYLSALAKAAEREGARIFAHSKAEKIEEDGQPVRVHTESGAVVTAQTLIVCTNAPVNDNASIYTKQAPYRTYVVGMRVPRGAVPQALYWDTTDPYHYVRLMGDDDDPRGEILIVGGEDHKCGQEDDMPGRLDRLERWARTVFPAAGEVVYRWSGQVFETIDGLAMIGRKPGGEPWSLIATGDSGMGMTHGTIAGILLSHTARGADHVWEKVYDPGRMRLKSATEFLKENANVGAEMVSNWIKPSEADSPEKIPAGSGAVLRKGASKIALYRDDKGSFHACSAVCPHKGCIVQWNDGEKSWDCPCHGSRYDARGKVLTGPTIKDLEPLPDWEK